MKTHVMVLLLVIVVCIPSAALAHKPLLIVEDNGDGTIYVETGFSDGSSGAGHKIILKDKETEEVLSELTIPKGGYIEEIPMPDVPYTVSFDAGAGHAVVKDGPFSADAQPVEAAEPAIEEEQPEAAPEAEAAPEEAVEDEPGAAAPPEPAASAAAEPAQLVRQPVAAQPVPAQVPVMTAATMSPGMERALNMMMTSQMVSALAVLVVLGAVMFLVGYMVGKDAGKSK
jgi:hypothetical protein